MIFEAVEIEKIDRQLSKGPEPQVPGLFAPQSGVLRETRDLLPPVLPSGQVMFHLIHELAETGKSFNICDHVSRGRLERGERIK